MTDEASQEQPEPKPDPNCIHCIEIRATFKQHASLDPTLACALHSFRFVFPEADPNG